MNPQPLLWPGADASFDHGIDLRHGRESGRRLRVVPDCRHDGDAESGPRATFDNDRHQRPIEATREPRGRGTRHRASAEERHGNAVVLPLVNQHCDRPPPRR
jgi:hypothetical protein